MKNNPMTNKQEEKWKKIYKMFIKMRKEDIKLLKFLIKKENKKSNLTYRG